MDQGLCIGSSPYDEPCAQLGREGYHEQARQECRALIGQLRRMFGPEPDGARLYLNRNQHDFGVYLTVECAYAADVEKAAGYAFMLEAKLPARWDAQALRELSQTDHGETREEVSP